MSLPTYQRKKNILDLTPLIDVMFLLLIFFMLTLPSETSASLPVTLPSAEGEKELLDSGTLQLTLTASGLIFINNDKYEIEGLAQALKNRKDLFNSILIRGDHRGQLGFLVKVWTICNESGFKQIKIAVNEQ